FVLVSVGDSEDILLQSHLFPKPGRSLSLSEFGLNDLVIVMPIVSPQEMLIITSPLYIISRSIFLMYKVHDKGYMHTTMQLTFLLINTSHYFTFNIFFWFNHSKTVKKYFFMEQPNVNTTTEDFIQDQF
ncbi:hypothetical protein ACJX0J_012307, partial [Zea mays]